MNENVHEMESLHQNRKVLEEGRLTEFRILNAHLLHYCPANHITFTRARPYKKNDSCYVEQENWSAVRKIPGPSDSASSSDVANSSFLHGSSVDEWSERRLDMPIILSIPEYLTSLFTSRTYAVGNLRQDR